MVQPLSIISKAINLLVSKKKIDHLIDVDAHVHWPSDYIVTILCRLPIAITKMDAPVKTTVILKLRDKAFDASKRLKVDISANIPDITMHKTNLDADTILTLRIAYIIWMLLIAPYNDIDYTYLIGDDLAEIIQHSMYDSIN